MAKVKTLTVYPSGYVADDYAYESASNIENGYNSADNTTYAKIFLKTGSSAETYIYYTFDLSNIPSEAVITSMACSAKANVSVSNSNYISTKTMQLYSGTAAKGSSSILSTSADVKTMTVGDWTVDELSDIRLKLYAKRGTFSTSKNIYINFYGATLTITYTEPDIVPIVGNTTIGGVLKELAGGYCNIGGAWKAICKSYATVNGVWKPIWKADEIVLYTWKKYKVNTASETTYSLVESTAITYVSSTVWNSDMDNYGGETIYKTMSFDDATGNITFSDSIGTITSRANMKTLVNTYGNTYAYVKGYCKFKIDSDDELCRIVMMTNGETTTTQSQGNYIEDVISENYNAYPDNGIQDGYWYVRL